jgi:hypothetical protein
MKANRAIFKKYIHTSNQEDKHLIEKKFVEDDFVMDALEGYRQEPNAWSSFEAADKKFFKTQRNRRLALSTAGLLVSLYLGLYFIPEAATKNNLSMRRDVKRVQVIRIHKPSDVKSMVAASPNDRITPRQVIEDLKSSTNTNEQKAEFLERIAQIPATQVEFKHQKQRRLAIKMGRELYIKNFKVIDYRYYRKGERTAGPAIAENELGEQEVNIPYINILNKAIEYFAQQDYKLSLLHFDEILQTYPDDANALFYGAMSLINLSEFNQAEIRLLKLQSIPFANFSEEAEWYLLHVYQRTKKAVAFEQLKNQIIEANGFYSQRCKNFNFN